MTMLRPLKASAVAFLLCLASSANGAEGDAGVSGGAQAFVMASPDAVVTAYIGSMKKGDLKTAYELLSSEDRAVRPLARFTSDYKGLAQGFEGILAMSTYRVVGITVSEKSATATIETTHPDPKILLGLLITTALSGDKEGADKAIAEKLRSGGIPMTTSTTQKALVHEAGGWRVYEGFKIKDEISRLFADAEELEKQARYDDAIKKYDELLARKSDIGNVSGDIWKKREKIIAKREDAEKKLARAKENAAYIDNVKLYDLKAGYFESILDGKVPGVTFKLKNDGTKTLNRVKVAVYFKDMNGSIIAEESYLPVFVSNYSFRTDNKPLKPGYIWQIERGKFYSAKSVPSEWAEGSVGAKIIEIEIAQDVESAMGGGTLLESPAHSGDVHKAQRLLKELGYDPGPIDGVLGSQTQNAVRDFQKSQNLAIDGNVTKALLGALEGQLQSNANPSKASRSTPKAAKDPDGAVAHALRSPPRSYNASQPLTISEVDLVRQQIARCWNLPAGAKDADGLIVEIHTVMNPDGTVREARIIDQARMQGDALFRSAAESALRAVLNPRCSPLRLPPEKYDQWKSMTLNFNPKEMF